MRFVLCPLLLVVAGCSSTYYGVMDALGHDKREILAERVDSARAEQLAAKQDVVALGSAFQRLVAGDGAGRDAVLGSGLDRDDPLGRGGDVGEADDPDGHAAGDDTSGSNGTAGDGDASAGDPGAPGFDRPPEDGLADAQAREQLELALERVRTRCERRAGSVERRRESFERVARDLYDEWSEQAARFRDAGLQQRSEGLLQDTRARYGRLLEATQRAESEVRALLHAVDERLLLREHALHAGLSGLEPFDGLEIDQHVLDVLATLDASIAAAGNFLERVDAVPPPGDGEEIASFRDAPPRG